MRYAIARGVPGLPPPAIQRGRLQTAGYDFLLEDDFPSRASQHALNGLLRELGPGDEVLACSLSVLQTPSGELTKLLDRFCSQSSRLWLINSDGAAEDLLQASTRRLLAVMAENEQQWPARVSITERQRRRPQLTSYQLQYARELRRRGETLRSIGLLFQVSPGDLAEMLGGDTTRAERGAAGQPDGAGGRGPRVFVTQDDLTPKDARDRPASSKASR